MSELPRSLSLSLSLKTQMLCTIAPLLPWEERNFSFLPSSPPPFLLPSSFSLPLFSSFPPLLRLYLPSLRLELPLFRLSITFGNLSSSSFPFFHGSTPAGSFNLLFEVFRFGFLKTRSTHFRKILPRATPPCS
jgi:hypothetical protein